MLLSEVLGFWAFACEKTGVSWSLYKDTLLCAAGYGEFPETLKNAQVAVFAKNLDAVLKQVVPFLPAGWRLKQRTFGRSAAPLTFQMNGAVMLEVYLLCGTDSAEDTASFDPIRKIRKKANGSCKLKEAFGGLLGKPVRKLLKPSCRRIAMKAYNRVLPLFAALPQDTAFYSDALCEKSGASHPAEWFASFEMLTCKTAAYPVFSGWREYLTAVYFDYEAGLTDEIGVGLTAEDKLALKAHQENCRKALAFIEEVAKEYNLRYYLLAGSVLGPVRHQGFIPWDDDIDLGIRVEDLAEFERIMTEELPKRLPENFKIVQSGPNNPYPRMFSKLCCDGRCCMDFWPLVPTYEKGFRAKFQWYFAKIITKVHYRKIDYKVTRFVKLVNLMSAFMSDKLVMKLARRNERKYIKRNTPAYINLYSIYKRPKELIKREWLDTKATAMFDGLEIPVVGCTHDYLTHLYGNYMGFPAPWKRASRHVERF